MQSARIRARAASIAMSHSRGIEEKVIHFHSRGAYLFRREAGQKLPLIRVENVYYDVLRPRFNFFLNRNLNGVDALLGKELRQNEKSVALERLFVIHRK